MKLRLLALPVLAAGLVLGGCSANHDRGSSYDRSQTQQSNSTTAPPPAGLPGGASGSAGPQYPNTGGSR